MNLLIVTQSVDNQDQLLGFFTRWLSEFAKHFSEVHVICLFEGTHSLPQNVFVHSLGKEKGNSRLSYIFNFYKHIFSLRKRCDAVFVHMNPVYLILGGPFWKIWGKKIGLWYTHKHVDMKLRLGTLFSDKIFSASKESFRLKTPKLLVTGHGIDLNEGFVQNKVAGTELRLSIVGRISEIKQTLKAMHILELLTKDMKATLSVIGDAATLGDAAYKEKVILYIKEKQLRDIVTLKGALSHKEVLESFGQTDIMLHTSQTGSVDKVVLEALLSDTLVLTENESFKSALSPLSMYMEKSEPKDYVERMREFAADENKRKTTIEAGKQWVKENHSLENLIPKIKAAYSTKMEHKEIKNFYDSGSKSRYEFDRWFINPERKAGFDSTKETLLKLLKRGDLKFQDYLEMGPGPGTWTEIFAPYGARMDVVDISEEMLAIVRNRFEGKSLRAFRCDFLEYQADKQYDFFFSSRALEYFTDKDVWAKKLNSLLVPKAQGIVITKMPHYLRAKISGKKFSSMHNLQIGSSELRKIFERNGFKVKRVVGATYVFPVLHSGFLDRLLYKILSPLGTNFFTRFFMESYAISFEKI